MAPVLQTEIPGLAVRRGKVRDVFDLGEQLLLVASDRISAFDWVMPNGIPDKGRILTQLSAFWFDLLQVPHHLLSLDVDSISLPATVDRGPLRGRSMICRKANIVPIECVVRGYLEGSGWKEYRQNQAVCGVELPAGLQQCDRLPEAIFTPATKEESGHDINITFSQMVDLIGQETADQLKLLSLGVYERAAKHALTRGVIIADTKLEWGWHDGKLILCDEVLTPDSSRFWPADRYQSGRAQPSYDKQFVREWLEQSGWDKNSPPPVLPDDVAQQTRAKYLEALERLTGKSL
ncbi:Phosphoribosylaminoimidazole-succinocarboxamide synthase [Anatilimnocola aggregata]|uniref:Phosphoribosylaminoimidazole-succinocarboxamide synthase n=2 Tax=Anatilimnocola aggregata TaxID=2528021 RepID=A0A517YC68_9BACT|nr:Phosphoribosylaminoimidazole-succinocarboxamide synthase [Anatilimnocola aggregata]